MTIDLRNAQVGDKLVLRNGSIVTYTGIDRSKIQPHEMFGHEAPYARRSDHGWMWPDGKVSGRDVVLNLTQMVREGT